MLAAPVAARLHRMLCRRPADPMSAIEELPSLILVDLALCKTSGMRPTPGRARTSTAKKNPDHRLPAWAGSTSMLEPTQLRL
jgi:hypothetical protein